MRSVFTAHPVFLDFYSNVVGSYIYEYLAIKREEKRKGKEQCQRVPRISALGRETFKIPF